MGKQYLYRRSFHCDQHLKSMERMLELEGAFAGMKVNANMSRVPTGDHGGFEAPRNSLDVPAGGFMEMRRHSEVRCEDIPIGYELSRSLTTRRRNDEFLVRKSVSAVDSILSKPKFLEKGISDSNQRSHKPSVVARLMGLEPLPHRKEAQSLHCQSELSSKRSVLGHDSFRSETEPSIISGPTFTMSSVSSHRAATSVADIFPDEKPALRTSEAQLLFRDNPQEKHLQDLGKELSMYQQKPPTRDRQLLLAPSRSQPQREKQGFQEESLHECQEFLDALDFLHTNKEFFAKVLRDPSSLFGKHLQQRGGGGTNKETFGHIKGSRLQGISESRKDLREVSGSATERLGPKRGPHVCPPQIVPEPTESTRMHGTNHLEFLGRKPLSVCTSRSQQDECMRQRSQPSSPLKGLGGNDQDIATKIVVLRPKVGRHAKSRPHSPISPPSDVADSTNIKSSRPVEGKNGMFKHGVKERLRYEPPSVVAEQNFLKDGEDKAGRIGERLKEDMSKRLSGGISRRLELSLNVKSGRRGKGTPTAQRVGVQGDTSGASDGEGYCPSSRKVVGDGLRANISLPCSPRLSRSELDVDARFFGERGRKGDPGQNKSSRAPSSATTCRDYARRENVGCAPAVLVRKQDSVRDSEPLYSIGRGRVRSSNKNASEAPKVSQRSFSSPAVKNRAINHEAKGAIHVNRLASCPNRSRTAQASPLKEKVMNLKDDLRLSKKKSSKKQSATHSSHPLECVSSRTSEDDAISDGIREHSCTMPSAYPWRTPHLSHDQTDVAAMVECFEDGITINKLQAHLNGVHQWPSSAAGDLLDSASDASLEKCEQPSPVSVLATPFLEESPSPEQTSVCNEASMRFSPLESDYKKQLLDMQGAQLSSPTWHSSWFGLVIEETSCKCVNMPLETLSMFGIACACGAEDELIYIRDLLAFAGFTDNKIVKAHAFSREHGFSPSMFEKMESYYSSMQGKIGHHTPLNPLGRRMLFDVVDETLAWKLGESNMESWRIKQDRPGCHTAYTGKQLLEQIWSHLLDKRYVPCEFSEEESLDALASKDMMKDPSWMHSQSDIEAIAMEVEKLVCSDLIREMAYELKSKLVST